METQNQKRVTVVVSPRERFGVARLSLESIYDGADYPFDLVYVDARSPRAVSSWLKRESAQRGFRIVHRDRYLSPNEARNAGAEGVTSEFILFIDNDMVCAKNWLAPLVKAADETGADVVTSLICEGKPFHSRIHQATGQFARDKDAFFAAPYGQREMIDIQGHLGEQVNDVRGKLKRQETDVSEFHCFLMRRSFLEKMGAFDEEMYATRDHMEFSMSVLKLGGKIVLEPDSVATYVFPSSQYPITWADRDFFLLRWSPQWQLHSLDRLQQKWGITNDAAMADYRSEGSLTWRYQKGFVRPIVKQIPVVRSSWRLSQAAQKILERYARHRVEGLAAEYERQRAEQRQ